MKKLTNPFVNQKGYNCFVCSPHNPVGLHLDFFQDGETIVANWNPKDIYQGYPNVLHGGIQATLLDEVARWAVNVIASTGGVTSRMEVQYKKPVFIDRGSIRLIAEIIEQKKKITEVCARLYSSDDILCTEGIVYCYTYPPEVAREKNELSRKRCLF